MIRAIRDWLSYRRLRARWTHDADAGTWTCAAWTIHRVYGRPTTNGQDGWTGYTISLGGHEMRGVHGTLRLAIESVGRTPEAFVFRSRRGDVRDTAAEMLPRDEDRP